MTPTPPQAGVVIEIVQKDYSSLTSIIARIESYRDLLRGAALTLWTAALGLAIAQNTGLPAAAAAVLVTVLGWADLRLDFEYDVAHRRSYKLEEVIQAYIDRVLEDGRMFEPQKQERLDDVLAAYTFGSNLNLLRPSARKVFKAANRQVRWPTYLYAALLLTLVGGGLLLELVS